MLLLKVLIIILVCLLVFHFTTRKYVNPYKLFCVVGGKGSGKSTLGTKLAVKAHKKGRTVYSNFDIAFARKIDLDELGEYIPEPNSLVIIDEGQMKWDSRNFKTLSQPFKDLLALQRKYKLEMWIFSQTFTGLDKRIRDLSDYIYLCQSYLRVFTVARRLVKTPAVVTTNSEKAESQIIDTLKFVPFFVPNSIIFTHIPSWIPYFNSWECPKKEYIKYQDSAVLSESITSWKIRNKKLIIKSSS